MKEETDFPAERMVWDFAPLAGTRTHTYKKLLTKPDIYPDDDPLHEEKNSDGRRERQRVTSAAASCASGVIRHTVCRRENARLCDG